MEGRCNDVVVTSFLAHQTKGTKNLQISFSVIEYFTDFTILLHKADPEKNFINARPVDKGQKHFEPYFA